MTQMTQIKFSFVVCMQSQRQVEKRLCVTFFLLYCQHGQCVDDWVRGQRCLKGNPHDILTNQLKNDIDYTILWGEALKGHVPGSTPCADKYIILFVGLKGDILKKENKK